MRTPTQEQWQTVIDNLYSILPLTLENEHHLDMTEPCVNYFHECGTVHCVGGWYAIACYKETVFITDECFNYNDGANAMAVHLGFSGRPELQTWAIKNPDLWGNQHGELMFTSNYGYANSYNTFAKSIADVIHHFELVKENCKQHEQRA